MSFDPLDRFDHLVVLMLENRSFDSLLGYLYEHDEPQRFIPDADRAFRGVAGLDLSNGDGANPGRTYRVRKAPSERTADMYAPYPNAGEFYVPNINRQLYGSDEVSGELSDLPAVAPMQGFVEDYIRAIGDAKSWDGNVEATPETVQQIMNCFPPAGLPVLSTLARSFAVSDAWFSSVPSATWSNRSFVHSATSRGRVLNKPATEWALHHEQPTIFERLTDTLGPERAWRVYGEEIHLSSLTRLLHRPLRQRRFRHCFQSFRDFERDCAEGTLPAYSFVEPRSLANPNNMHPPFWLHPHIASSLLAGELLVNDVYDAVRRGKRWERTLLVVTFDEHGGLYDHVPPPTHATPPERDRPAGEFGFRFDRFGPRVPTIFVSPWVDAGTVVRAAGDVPFDHTSIVKTLCRRFGCDGLTERDRAAPDFLPVLCREADTPRTDAPEITPRPYERLPEPKAQLGPLSHLGFQAVELTYAVAGKVAPRIERVGEAIRHLRDHARTGND